MKMLKCESGAGKGRNWRLWSPLRWPGGKSGAVQTLAQFIPDEVNTVMSPFVGGASFEIALGSSGIRTIAYDRGNKTQRILRNGCG